MSTCNNPLRTYSHLSLCAVRAAPQVPEEPEKVGSLFAVLIVSLVLKESSAMKQVGIPYSSISSVLL